MGLFDKLFGKKQHSNTFSDEELVQANVCPNCWGKQNYDGEYLAFVEDQTKANINHDKSQKKTFIQQFVETNVTGIRLKRDGDSQICPACQGRHKTVPLKS